MSSLGDDDLPIIDGLDEDTPRAFEQTRRQVMEQLLKQKQDEAAGLMDANTGPLPVSHSHRLELDHRLEDRQENPEAESPWSEVADRLRKR